MNSEREGDEAVVEEQHTEAEAYEDIKNELGIEMVQFGYLPNDVIFLDYELDSTLKRAGLFYQCQDSILEYRISFSPTEQAMGYQVEDQLLNEQILNVNGTPITLKSYETSGSSEILYVANFEYQSIYYTITGNLSDAEMKEIIKNLYFL